MAIVTISRGTYSMGKRVARKVAENLGFDLISRKLLFESSDLLHIPKKELEKSIHDAPGIFEQHRHTKEIYLAYIRSTLIEMVAKGDVVYHGLAGHILLNQLPHVFKVRLTASLESRIQRKQMEGFSLHEAKMKILEDDEQRKKWTEKIYHADPNDISLYDLVVKIDKFSIDDAAALICEGAQKKTFELTPDGVCQSHDLLLACKLKAKLVENCSDIGVTCEHGNLLVYARSKKARSGRLKTIFDNFLKENEAAYNIEVHYEKNVPLGAV